MNDKMTNSKKINKRKRPSIGSQIPFMHSIQVKAWAGIFIVTLLPLIALGYSSFSILTDISGDLLVKSNLQAFQQVKYEFDEYIKNYERLVRFLSHDSRLQSPNDPQAAEALRQMDKSYEFIDRIIICDREGVILQHSKKEQKAISELRVPEEGALLSDRTVSFSPESFLIKIPLNELDGSPVIIATVSFVELRKSLEGITFGTSFHYYLVTSSGENVLEQPDFPAELISALLERPCGAYGVSSKGENNKNQVAISLPILNYNLKMFVFQDADEVYKIAGAIKHRTYVVVFVLGMFSLIFGTIFVRHFTAPIIEIAEKANELSGGNLKVNVRIKRDDEIGFLAQSFNRMTTRIRNKVFELSSVYKISQLISSANTYQQALDSCLSHIVTMFLARRGSIMLIGDDKTKLRVESFRNFGQEKSEEDHKPKTTFELKIGEGIAGQVVETGQAILCADCNNDERFKSYENEGKSSPTTLVSVPLTVHGKTIGVINLADRSTSSLFDEDDLSLLKSIASQIAVSIDNAKLKELAITDELTGLFIDKYFKIRLDDEIKRAKRFDIPLSLALLEIDNYEKFVAENGEKAASYVLKKIADELIASVRGTDVPCHYTDTILSVILAHTSDDNAVIFTERFREKIAATEYEFSGKALRVSISVGVVELTGKKTTRESFIESADLAIKTSQKSGGNTTTVLPKENKEVSNDK